MNEAAHIYVSPVVLAAERDALSPSAADNEILSPTLTLFAAAPSRPSPKQRPRRRALDTRRPTRSARRLRRGQMSAGRRRGQK